ncbi:MAG: SoxR reducing system RseC family protein [Gammaproteobacteria bacterium]|nr:SoxR reducing system RseC family protein [Gammaproteobacteria bacterium]MBT8109918.1 SoxR reducing system RseC family protein [Gammaproteobacteria bacterium]NND47548.1 SoxR reducing system RseC family protein [Woeseiaceae bacterium]NNL44620.1 SoxR reducing system RseC family protein [Woeseiaceae bacterium]
MDNPRGRVIAVRDFEPAPYALVEVDASVSCARCAEGKGCGAGLLGRTSGSRRVDALVATGLTVREGDEVRIELAPSNLLQASMIVYGLPLAGAILGAGFAYIAGIGELNAAMAALGGILAGLIVARLRLKQDGCLRQFTPTVVERLTVAARSSEHIPGGP